MKTKSYNPFKMWGSYVGAVIGLIPLLSLSGILTFSGNTLLSFLFFPEILIGLCDSCVGNMKNIIYHTPLTFWLFVIIGIAKWSLIGWGIHSLIRKLRR